MAKGAFTEKTRRVIIERAKGRCEVCGLVVNYGQIHHRQPRGMGGTSSRGIESAANGLYVHPSCHRKIEMNREKSYLLGHLVRTGASPEEAQVRLWDGWFVLSATGKRTDTIADVNRP